jgi:SEC-C motif-containing protein
MVSPKNTFYTTFEQRLIITKWHAMNNQSFPSFKPDGLLPFTQTCPCRVRETKSVHFDQCCAPYLSGQALAPTAQALMRSRYSAYALGGRNAPMAADMLRYLKATWHPDTLPQDLSLDPMQWTGLKVLGSQEDGDHGSVNFVAFYKEGGKTERLAEHSAFERVKGAWLYTKAKGLD